MNPGRIEQAGPDRYQLGQYPARTAGMEEGHGAPAIDPSGNVDFLQTVGEQPLRLGVHVGAGVAEVV